MVTIPEREFWNLYQKGFLLKALQGVFLQPNEDFDVLEKQRHFSPEVLHYLDALVEGNASSALLTNLHLQNVCPPSALPSLQLEALLFEQSLGKLQQCHEWFHTNPHPYLHMMCKEKGGEVMDDSEIERLAESFDTGRAETFTQIARFSRQVVAFQHHRKNICKTLRMQWRPFAPLSFPLEGISLPRQENIEGRIPIFFVEPYALPWEEILRPWVKRPACFLFPRLTSLWQSLQFPALAESLCDPTHVIVVLSYYAHRQLAVQDTVPYKGKKTVLMYPSLWQGYREQMDCVKNSLEALFSLKHRSWTESSPAEDLFQRCLQVERQRFFQRYGSARRLVCTRIAEGQDWCSRYVHFSDKVKQGGERRQITLQKRDKIRVAHVIHRLQDRGSAPSKRLHRLLNSYDLDRYDVFLYVLDSHVLRLSEYPYLFAYDLPSSELAPSMLTQLREKGISCILSNPEDKYTMLVKKAALSLEHAECQVVFFHNNDAVVEELAAQLSSCVRVYFEHGALPKRGVFDWVYLNHEQEIALNKERWEELGVRCMANPLCIDFSEELLEKPLSKASLGFSEDVFLLTTVSHLLDERLSYKMCHSIAQVLRQNAHVHYAPIGYIRDLDGIYDVFREQGVERKVHFLGQLEQPISFLQAADVYLNEYPVGSGLAAFEAMAAGCPIVTMYDPHQSLKSREAAFYFGEEKAIHSCQWDEYAQRIERLVREEQTFQSWHMHALQEYHRRSHEEKYFQRHRDFIESLFTRQDLPAEIARCV